MTQHLSLISSMSLYDSEFKYHSKAYMFVISKNFSYLSPYSSIRIDFDEFDFQFELKRQMEDFFEQKKLHRNGIFKCEIYLESQTLWLNRQVFRPRFEYSDAFLSKVLFSIGQCSSMDIIGLSDYITKVISESFGFEKNIDCDFHDKFMSSGYDHLN